MTTETNESAAPQPTVTNSPMTYNRERAEDGKFKAKEGASEGETQLAKETGQPAAEKIEPAKTETPEQAEARKPNRTGEFIDRLKTENREMRERLARLEASQPKPEPPKAPAPEEFYQDPVGWSQRNTEYAVQQARQQWEDQQRATQQQTTQQQAAANFRSRAEKFAETTPDFADVISSVPADLLPDDMAHAIIGHERGPELAYHLAKNSGDLIQLLSTPEQYRGYAIEALASRLTATQPQAPNPAAVPPAKPVRPVPSPVTTLSGAPAAKKSYAQMSMKEYDAQRRKERQEKGLR